MEREGTLQSQGVITIDWTADIAKYHQLPRPYAWILKLVQFAVSIQASQIRIEVEPTQTVFSIWDGQSISPQQLDALLQNIRHGSGWQQHLKRGLWGATANLHPTEIQLAKAHKSLVINMDRLLWRECPLRTHTEIRVSHTRRGDALNLLRSVLLESQDLRKQIARELHDYAFTCPIPLLLGDERIDNLLLCPSHGRAADIYPLGLFHQGDPSRLVHGWKIPPATFGTTLTFTGKNSILSRLWHAPELPLGRDCSRPAPVSFAGLMATKIVSGLGGGFQLQPHHSVVYWIWDGVVVGRQRSTSMSPVSCALFLPAQNQLNQINHLRLDASSLQLVENPQLDSLVHNASLSAQSCLGMAKPNWQGVSNAQMKEKLSFMGNFAVLLGGLTIFVGSVSGLVPVELALASILLGGRSALGLARANREDENCGPVVASLSVAWNQTVRNWGAHFEGLQFG